MNRLRWLSLVSFLLVPAALCGQQSSQPYYQPHFPPEEFKARWEKIYDKIGDRAAAVVQGMPKVPGFIFPRQNNEFYYLCGIETPHAYLILDGKSRKATLFLPPRDARTESAEGRILSADDAPLVKKLTGVDAVLNSPHWRLTGLMLAQCQLRPDVARVLASSPRLARLEVLDLSENDELDVDDLAPLAESEYLSSQTELDIRGIGGRRPSSLYPFRMRLGRRLSE